MARGVTVGAGTGTRDDGRIRAGMLLLWGVAATVRNLLAGRQVDRFERSGGDHDRRANQNEMPSNCPACPAHRPRGVAVKTGCRRLVWMRMALGRSAFPPGRDAGFRPCHGSSTSAGGNPWTSRLRTVSRSSRSRAAAFAVCTRPGCLPISRRRSAPRLRPAST
ncbi:hypothetical protein CBM2585_B50195 [Cupriavidus taiwanensis]|nr:hypothetical protein CBM2585_B50195 [Cupriavidus taiwanensis]